MFSGGKHDDSACFMPCCWHSCCVQAMYSWMVQRFDEDDPAARNKTVQWVNAVESWKDHYNKSKLFLLMLFPSGIHRDGKLLGPQRIGSLRRNSVEKSGLPLSS